MTTNPIQCTSCHVFTSNGDAHVCLRYDGPPCTVCGAGTVAYTVGAPGFGAGVECENGHDVPTSPQGILTPEQTR